MNPQRSQMFWSGTVAILVGLLALYQIFGRAPNLNGESPITQLESRHPASLQ